MVLHTSITCINRNVHNSNGKNSVNHKIHFIFVCKYILVPLLECWYKPYLKGIREPYPDGMSRNK